MSWHADAILAAISTDGAKSMIAASWRRCATLQRLDPDEFRLPERDPRALRGARDRDARLIAIASPHLGRLFDAVGDPEGGISLIDRDGIMVALRAEPSQDVHERRPERWLGADLSEASAGPTETAPAWWRSGPWSSAAMATSCRCWPARPASRRRSSRRTAPSVAASTS